MLLHYRTIPATSAILGGNYLGVSEDLRVVPLVFDAGEDEFYFATDMEYDRPVAKDNLEVVFINNPDAIFTNAEVAELSPPETPEEEGADANADPVDVCESSTAAVTEQKHEADLTG